MRQLAFRAALAAIAAALAVPGLAPAATRNNTLITTDGPGFTITINKTTVKAGTYFRKVEPVTPPAASELAAS